MEAQLNPNIIFDANADGAQNPHDTRQFLEDELLETQSVSTIGGHEEKIVNNYKRDLDPSLFSAQKIRCCDCGVMTTPNESNKCINCLKSHINITNGIPKQIDLFSCKECNRYLRPPWVNCELESPELLAVCLKHIHGLKKVKLIDAGFVWTEAHSRRIKVKITIQKEVLNNTLLQQSFVVEFVIINKQCDECKKTYTPHLWSSIVQVRQRVDHKRTFLFLEQLIIKHKAADRAIGIKEVHDGIDFQFKSKADSAKLIDFISMTVPCKSKQSQQLINSDLTNNIFKYKYSTSIDIAPICKDDLVIIPKALSNQLGGIGPMIIVYKISTSIHIVDVFTMQTYELDQITYWKHQFHALCGRDRLTEFIVVNIEEPNKDFNVSRAAAKQKFKMVSVEVQRKEDYGINDTTFSINTHLGETLNFFDTVLGFDFEQMNFSEIDEVKNMKRGLPSVVLVKKTYPKARQRNQKNRVWKLKTLEKETLDENNHHKKEKSKAKNQRDIDLFMQDIEEEPDLRQQIDLFKDEEVIEQIKQKEAKKLAQKNKDEGQDPKEEEKEDAAGGKKKKKKQREEKEEDGDVSVEEDFPEIKVDDLKTYEHQLQNLNIQDEEDDGF
eukprot:403354861